MWSWWSLSRDHVFYASAALRAWNGEIEIVTRRLHSSYTYIIDATLMIIMPV